MSNPTGVNGYDGHPGNPHGIGGFGFNPQSARAGVLESARARHRGAKGRAVDTAIETMEEALPSDPVARAFIRAVLGRLYERGYDACASAKSQRQLRERRAAAETPRACSTPGPTP